jgi:hypothetical protein
MSNEKHVREERVLALKAEYDAIRRLYSERCEQWGMDDLPCFECDYPDSFAAIKEIIWRTLTREYRCLCCPTAAVIGRRLFRSRARP